MGFSKAVKEKVLIAAARHCCVCHKSSGLNIEVHHIVQAADGGEDTFENAIPLCFDCHANAGHYNSRHPKGIKYSKSELIKHRDRWYEIVEKGSLNFVNKNVIDTNYFLVSDLSGLNDIIYGDSSRLKLSNTMVYQNDILKFWKGLIGNDKFWISRKYGKKLEYVEKIENGVYKDKLMSLESPSKDELVDVSPLVDYLNKSEIDVDKYCRKYIYSNACGMSTNEYYEFRDFAFLFIGLRNKTKNDINLSNLKYKVVEEFEVYNKKSSTKGEEVYNLPPVSLKPEMTLLIPSGIILKQFKSDGYKTYNLSSEKVEGFIDNRINKYENEAPLNYSFTVGKSIIPLKISFSSKGKNYNEALRMIDLDNLYLIDRQFMMGSCPHLEIISESERYYLGELFTESSTDNQSVIFKVRENGLINIHEVEDETTFIDEIFVNGCLKYSGIVLHKGDTFQIDCISGDKIKIVGKYQLTYTKNFYYDDPINKMWNLKNMKGVPFNFA